MQRSTPARSVIPGSASPRLKALKCLLRAGTAADDHGVDHYSMSETADDLPAFEDDEELLDL